MPDINLEFTQNQLSVLMPVYNERKYLRKCVNKVLNSSITTRLSLEIIIVDDCSTDGTADIIKELSNNFPQIKSFTQPKNMGKGASISRAINEMTGEYAIIQDADLEYDPDEYEIVLKPLLDGHADVVYGSRFLARQMKRALFYHHKLGNLFLTHLSNFFTGLDLSDMETCYKAFRADVLKTIPIRSHRFGIEPEITAKISKRKFRVYEVPINYYGRSYNEGKKIGWKDGLQAIWTILKYFILDDCYDERYGHEILSSISGARKFNNWMADIVNQYTKNSVLEIGSGIGNISSSLSYTDRLTVSDVDDNYIKILDNKFKDDDEVNVEKFNLDSDRDAEIIGRQSYDSIVCLNVLEHIEDDNAALLRLNNILDDSGRLILLVPQYKALYGALDKQIDHYRRYNKNDLVKLVESAGYHVDTTQSFNFFSIFGWWVNTCLFKRTKISKIQLKIFDTLIPFIRIVEKILPLPGLSLIVVATKK